MKIIINLYYCNTVFIMTHSQRRVIRRQSGLEYASVGLLSMRYSHSFVKCFLYLFTSTFPLSFFLCLVDYNLYITVSCLSKSLIIHLIKTFIRISQGNMLNIFRFSEA